MDNFAALLASGGLSLDRLRNFCRIADAGGLSKAAKGEAAQVSLMSRQVRELEQFFGAALVHRSGKNLTLTHAGRELAAVAHAHLAALADFQRACCEQPLALSLGSSNSVLQWLVLPRLGELRAQLPGVEFTFASGRTVSLADRVRDLCLDFAIVRSDAVPGGFRSELVAKVAYALYVPVPLVRDGETLRTMLSRIPIATSSGGRFGEIIEAAAARARLKLRYAAQCTSFTQAARGVQSGVCAAILPTLAAVDFDPVLVREFPLPFLRSYLRPLVLVWNPRLANTRAIISRAAELLPKALRRS